jgi:hypothetical protein
MPSCAHEQKAHVEVQLIGVANKTVFMTLVGLTKRLECTEASLQALCLRVAQMPRSRDLAIFVLTTTDNKQTN